MRQEAALKREQRANPGAVAPIADDDSDELALENMLTDIIGRVISLKLNKTDPEFKVFKEHPERGVQYFNERFNFLPDEIVVDIFVKIQDHATEIVQLLSRCMLERAVFNLFSQSFTSTSPSLLTYCSMK